MRILIAAGLGLGLAVLVACGARTGLPVPTTHAGTGGSAPDAGRDAGPPDAAEDAPVDAPVDAPEDAPVDAPPPFDCVDAGVTFIYVMTEENDLYSFYPPTLTFSYIGTIACPTPVASTPFSMAVDRSGLAYVVFNDGSLYKVKTSDAACEPTSFTIGQSGFLTFGMGFSANVDDPGETLYVASDAVGALGTIDTNTLDLTPIGNFDAPIGRAELTGTRDGQLWAFGIDNATSSSQLARIDKKTAGVSDVVPLGFGSQVTAWAFAFWGGDFYFFTSQNGVGSSTVTRYRPADGSITDVQTIARTIVGAGVSTCAPQ
jgi:hypothetical protein